MAKMIESMLGSSRARLVALMKSSMQAIAIGKAKRGNTRTSKIHRIVADIIRRHDLLEGFLGLRIKVGKVHVVAISSISEKDTDTAGISDDYIIRQSTGITYQQFFCP